MKWRKKCFPERESASWPPTKPCTTPTASAAPIAKSISEREGPRPTHAITPASLPTLRDVDWFYRVGIMKKTGTRGIFMGFCFLNWGGRLPAPPPTPILLKGRGQKQRSKHKLFSLSLLSGWDYHGARTPGAGATVGARASRWRGCCVKKKSKVGQSKLNSLSTLPPLV